MKVAGRGEWRPQISRIERSLGVIGRYGGSGAAGGWRASVGWIAGRFGGAALRVADIDSRRMVSASRHFPS